MSGLRTTYAMVLDARAAASAADDLVVQTGVLVAEAMADGLNLDLYVHTFRQARAQRVLASAILSGTLDDWHRALEATS